MTKSQKKAVDESKKQAGVGLHRLVRPFQRDFTKLWRDRDRIRNALENIRDNADEAYLCLAMDDLMQQRLPQASTALREMEIALKELNA